MNKTYETICKLVSTAMYGSAISYEKDIDWSDVFEEMKLHGIASLVGDIIADIPMEIKIKEKWKDYVFYQQIYWEKAITVQDDVCRILNDIRYVILKGMSASIYYPNPGLRSMGDIDVLVNRNDNDTAIGLINNNGYTVLSESLKQHNEYCKDGVEIELHDFFAVALTKEGKTSIENRVINKLAVAKDIYFKGHMWKILPKFENGLTLIYHIFHHFSIGVGFRQIIDWMMFVNDSDDIDWKEFNKITKADEIYKFQCIITKMCSLNFGLPPKETIMWMNDVENEACEKVFDYVASKGNFGRKQSVADFRDQLTLKNKITGLIPRLQSGGRLRWEAAKKHKTLRPFAWIYQGCRVINIMIQRKEPIKAISRDIKESKKIIEIYELLNIPRSDARGEKHKEV